MKCAPPAEDKQGKDWSERWRLAERDGVEPVVEALNMLRCPPERAVATPALPTAIVLPAEPPGGDTTPWLADPRVQHLLAHGYELVEARILDGLVSATARELF